MGQFHFATFAHFKVASDTTGGTGWSGHSGIGRNSDSSRGDRRVEEGARYLGYGVMQAGQRARACLTAPFEFDVVMRLREQGLSQEQQQSVRDALIALGSMGSNCRKGYGSLNLIWTMD